MAEEITLVAEAGDPATQEAGEGWQRSITADYDPEHRLVQFVQCGEEVFGTLEPVEPEEWQQIVDRLGRAAPFMERVLALVQEVERIATAAAGGPISEDLKKALRTFAGAIEPEDAVAVAHAHHEEALPLIGRDRVLLDGLAEQLHKEAQRGHNYGPLVSRPRGVAFEVQIVSGLEPTGRVARVTVELDRVEETG